MEIIPDPEPEPEQETESKKIFNPKLITLIMIFAIIVMAGAVSKADKT